MAFTSGASSWNRRLHALQLVSSFLILSLAFHGMRFERQIFRAQPSPGGRGEQFFVEAT